MPLDLGICCIPSSGLSTHKGVSEFMGRELDDNVPFPCFSTLTEESASSLARCPQQLGWRRMNPGSYMWVTGTQCVGSHMLSVGAHFNRKLDQKQRWTKSQALHCGMWASQVWLNCLHCNTYSSRNILKISPVYWHQTPTSQNTESLRLAS